MATITAPSFTPLAQPERLVQARGGISAYKLIITYMLLFPLVFFAVRGSFSFEYTSLNNGATGSYGALVNPNAGNGSAAHSAEMILCFGLIGLAIAPFWRKVAAACLDNKLCFALPLWAILSVFWSQEPKRTIAFAVLVFLHTIFAVYLPVRFTPRQQLQLFLLVGIVATVASFAVAGAMPSAGVDHKNAMTGLQGIYPHKNICSMVTISLMMPAFFYRFTGKSASIKRAAYLFITTALVLATTSRTGWLILASCLAFLYTANALRRVKRLERLLVVLFLPAVILLLCWLLFAFRLEILNLMGKDATLSGRTIIWKAVFLSVFKRPFIGFGYNAFWIGFKGEAVHLAIATGDVGLGNAENGVLQLWLELGLVGVFLLFALLFHACRNAIRCFRSDTPGYALWYMTMIFITLLALVDGDKFMLSLAIEWTMLVLADVGLAMQAKRIRTSLAT